MDISAFINQTICRLKIVHNLGEGWGGGVILLILYNVAAAKNAIRKMYEAFNFNLRRSNRKGPNEEACYMGRRQSKERNENVEKESFSTTKNCSTAQFLNIAIRKSNRYEFWSTFHKCRLCS